MRNARLVDGTGAPPRDRVTVVVEDGTIVRVGAASDATPDGADVLDLEGRTLLPGLIDAHVHVTAFDLPKVPKGEAVVAAEVKHHFIAAGLQQMLRMGITTLRDVGAFGDDLLHARRAIELGAFTGPRVLACGRILSATSPGGAHFAGMYREADGEDEMRKATREQIRRGADFIKLMTTGARSVVLEDPEPAQVTRAEVATVVEEAHRMGFRVAAHCEGLDGTRLAIEEGSTRSSTASSCTARPSCSRRLPNRSGSSCRRSRASSTSPRRTRVSGRPDSSSSPSASARKRI